MELDARPFVNAYIAWFCMPVLIGSHASRSNGYCGGPRERRVDRDRHNRQAPGDRLDPNAALTTLRRGTTKCCESRSARRVPGLERYAVMPENVGGHEVVLVKGSSDCTIERSSGVGRRSGNVRRRHLCRRTCAAAPTRGSSECEQDGTDRGGRPHAANPACSSWARKRGPAASHVRLAPLPSKSGLAVRRFPSTPWTSTISSTWRGRKRCSPFS